MKTIYGLLFDNREEKELADKKEIIRIMESPVIYECEDTTQYFNCDGYSLILSEPFSNRDFINTSDYNSLFETIVRFFNDKLFDGIDYPSYVSNVSDYIISSGYIQFIYNNELKFVICNSADSYKKICYEVPKYYVVYDETQNVENDEMLTLMSSICNELKKTVYEAVKRWNYVDGAKNKSFYIFYTGKVPGDVTCKELVKEYLINLYIDKVKKEDPELSDAEAEDKAIEELEKDFPKIFITSERKIFCLYKDEDDDFVNNKSYIIDYPMLKKFVDDYNILAPEIIYILELFSPIIVEYGVSDIINNYKPFESDSYLNNQFLYYVSSVLNYYKGTKELSKTFKQESFFEEHEDYCSVVCGNVEWQIMKFSYTNSFFDVDGNYEDIIV